MENASHLLADGHLAHAEAAGDQHQPTGPEHGCTPLFHACSCHVSLNFLSPKSLPAINLRAAQHMSPLAPDLQPTGFWPAIDRPPQV